MASLGLERQFAELSEPIDTEEHRWNDTRQQPVRACSLVVNPEHKHRSLHWGDLHGLLLSQLPPESVHFAHTLTHFENTQVRSAGCLAWPAAAVAGAGLTLPCAGRRESAGHA